MPTDLLFHICARQGDDMSAAIGIEAQELVREAAKPVAPGSCVKQQIRQAAWNLGYPDGSWRNQAAWYGHASSWSAAAIRDLQDRSLRLREAAGRRATSIAETQALLRARQDRAELETARDAHRAQLSRIERQLAACEATLRIPPSDADCP